MKRKTEWGSDYEVPVGRAKARRYCGAYPLPRIGYETVVAVGADRSRLYVRNIAGRFSIGCSSLPRSFWPAVFGVSENP
jgi:hypothetical protein